MGDDILKNVQTVEHSAYAANIVAELGISFKSNYAVTVKQIKNIVRHCANLKALHLGRCHVSELDTCIITSTCNRLINFGFGVCSSISKNCVKTVSNNLREIEMFQLPPCIDLRVKVTNRNWSESGDLLIVFGGKLKDFDVTHNDKQCKSVDANIYALTKYFVTTTDS